MPSRPFAIAFGVTFPIAVVTLLLWSAVANLQSRAPTRTPASPAAFDAGDRQGGAVERLEDTGDTGAQGLCAGEPCEVG